MPSRLKCSEAENKKIVVSFAPDFDFLNDFTHE